MNLVDEVFEIMSKPTVETFEYGMQRYYLDDQQMVVVVGGGDMRRPSIDVWAELMVESINSAPDPAFTYMLLDLTNPNQGFTPYTSSKSNEVLHAMHPERFLYLAILYRDSVINNIIGIFLNRLMPSHPRFTYLTFKEAERDSAIAWLTTEREKNKNPKNS